MDNWVNADTVWMWILEFYWMWVDVEAAMVSDWARHQARREQQHSWFVSMKCLSQASAKSTCNYLPVTAQ